MDCAIRAMRCRRLINDTLCYKSHARQTSEPPKRSAMRHATQNTRTCKRDSDLIVKTRGHASATQISLSSKASSYACKSSAFKASSHAFNVSAFKAFSFAFNFAKVAAVTVGDELEADAVKVWAVVGDELEDDLAKVWAVVGDELEADAVKVWAVVVAGCCGAAHFGGRGAFATRMQRCRPVSQGDHDPRSDKAESASSGVLNVTMAVASLGIPGTCCWLLNIRTWITLKPCSAKKAVRCRPGNA